MRLNVGPVPGPPPVLSCTETNHSGGVQGKPGASPSATPPPLPRLLLVVSVEAD